jgi:hypothetical protein
MIRPTPRLAVWIAAAMVSHAVAAHAGLIDAELGVAGPSDFQVLSLGSTSTSTTSLNLNASTVNGNVGVADDGKFTSSAPNSVSGSAYVGASVNTSGVQSPVSGKLVVNDSLVTNAATAAFSASTYFAGLTPTLSTSLFNSGTISSNLTVTGSAGYNVVDLTSFSLSGGNLTLSGPASAQFVINITGGFTGTSGSVLLAGGLTADDVIFNITGTGSTVTTAVPDTVNAILLAPNRAITEDSGTYNGEVIGGYNQTITLMSSTVLSTPCTGGNTCSASVPEPSSLPLLGFGLLALGALLHRLPIRARAQAV